MNVAKPLSLSSAKPAIVVDNNATRGINNIEKKNSKLNQEQEVEDEQQPQQQENDQQSEAESSWNNDDNWDDMDQSDNNETFNNSNSIVAFACSFVVLLQCTKNNNKINNIL